MNLLIADANPDIRESVLSTFNEYEPDWRVSVVNSGCQALGVLKDNNSLDMVILGVSLIDISGLDLLIKIREDSDVPVVVITYDKDIYKLVAAFDAGANDYIVKPFNKRIFIARLKALNRRRVWDIQANKEQHQGIYITTK